MKWCSLCPRSSGENRAPLLRPGPLAHTRERRRDDVRARAARGRLTVMDSAARAYEQHPVAPEGCADGGEKYVRASPTAPPPTRPPSDQRRSPSEQPPGILSSAPSSYDNLDELVRADVQPLAIIEPTDEEREEFLRE